jgi:hypothetical protein
MSDDIFVALRYEVDMPRSCCVALLSLTDDEGIKRALGTTFFRNCGWTSNDLENYYMSIHGRSSAFFDTASYYDENIEKEYSILKQMVGGLRNFIDMSNNYQLFNVYGSSCLICFLSYIKVHVDMQRHVIKPFTSLIFLLHGGQKRT